MVNFDRFFKLLKEYGINVPVSVHFEYPLGGANRGLREITLPKEAVFRAMKKDLATIRKFWKNA